MSADVFQDPVVDRPLTGRRNLGVHARLWGPDPAAAAERIGDFAARASGARAQHQEPGRRSDRHPEKEANQAMTTIHADELQPGDLIVYNGHNHLITHVERRDGWAWPVAADGTGWAIALGRQLFDIQRIAA